MMRKRWLAIFITAFVTVSCLSLEAFGKEEKAYEIRWGTAPAGGVWQALGTAMLDDVIKSHPNLKGSTVPIGGAANVVAVNEGRLNAAFSFATTASEALEGIEFFEKYGKLQKIRGLAILFPEPTQIVIWDNSGITDIPQLKGKRITPGPKGSAIAVVTRQVLEAYGISFNDVKLQYMSFSEAGQQMLDKHIDAIVYGAMAYPAPPIVNVSSQGKIRMLSLSDDVIKKLLNKYEALEPYTLPVGCYKGVDYPVKGITANVVLIGREDMPESVAYDIVKSISENFENYSKVTKAIALGKREDMGKRMGIPFHPGALKYYKEKGWVK